MRKFLSSLVLIIAFFSSPALASSPLVMFGDSICSPGVDSSVQGISSSATDYAALISNSLGVTPSVECVTGAQAADQAIVAHNLAIQSNAIVTVEVGLNDELIYGSNTTLEVYAQAFLTDLLASPLLPNKIYGQSASCTGSWTNSSPPWAKGVWSDTTGNSCQAQITGSYVVIGTILQTYQGNPVPGTASVTVDGSVVGSISSNGVGFSTQNGPTGETSCCYAPGAYIFPTGSSGNHTIVVTVTSPSGANPGPVPNILYLEYIAGSSQPSGPQVYVSNLVPTPTVSGNLTAANNATYDSLVSSVVSSFRNAGLPASLIDISGMPASDQATGSLYPHPLDAGHAYIANAFLAAINGPPPPPPAWTYSEVQSYLGTPSGGGTSYYCFGSSQPTGAPWNTCIPVP